MVNECHVSYFTIELVDQYCRCYCDIGQPIGIFVLTVYVFDANISPVFQYTLRNGQPISRRYNNDDT